MKKWLKYGLIFAAIGLIVMIITIIGDNYEIQILKYPTIFFLIPALPLAKILDFFLLGYCSPDACGPKETNFAITILYISIVISYFLIGILISWIVNKLKRKKKSKSPKPI